MTRGIVVGAACAVAVMAAPLRAQQSCESLRGLALAHAVVTASVSVAEGPVGGRGPGGAAAVAPAHCAVQAIARPTGDSEIRFELWLPASGWNGKYAQVGNGVWAGMVNTGSLADPLRRGYAVAATDDGHQGNPLDAGWAIGHPEKLIDFGYRAVHETSVQARAIVRAFYGKDPERSYFIGCSTGGREALTEAQRYPEEFQGILAGAPAAAWSHLIAGGAWDLAVQRENPIPATKLPLIQHAALAACDARDGVEDGLIEDPRACRFDPAVLTCKGADGPDCLTKGQVAALKKIYAGARNPRTGAEIFPGYPPGTEGMQGGWSPWFIGANAIDRPITRSYYAQAVYEDPAWDMSKLDFDTDVAFADRKLGSVIGATNPDLRSFRASGGKLIQYHGWGDPAISPLSSTEYYDSVLTFLGRFPDPRSPKGPVQDFYRLFMVPGMSHCGGGLGATQFGQSGAAGQDPEHDIFSALEQWVEKGVAPDKIIASGKAPTDPSKTLTRPLCPYPRVARYQGSGDVNDAGSFACALPDRR